MSVVVGVSGRSQRIDATPVRNSQYSDAYYNRGLMWLTKGDSQRAAEDFRQTLAINPQDERALRALNQLLSVH
jgi:Tfp pilus assembly protein PilF